MAARAHTCRSLCFLRLTVALGFENPRLSCFRRRNAERFSPVSFQFLVQSQKSKFALTVQISRLFLSPTMYLHSNHNWASYHGFSIVYCHQFHPVPCMSHCSPPTAAAFRIPDEPLLSRTDILSFCSPFLSCLAGSIGLDRDLPGVLG